MRKLKLDLEEIAVESFPVTEPPADPAGTVKGREDTGLPSCTMFCTIQWPQECAPTQFCNPSNEIYCPTATCQAGCTAGCTWGPTWDQTCPPTCDWGGGCESTRPECPL